MEFKGLDQEFDAFIDRFDNKKPVSNTPYGTLPMASDHFLLKKSWDYFRNRVKTIEHQWQTLLESKSEEIKKVQSQLENEHNRILELEDENARLRVFEEEVRRLRLADFQQFDKNQLQLRVRWDEEREALSRDKERAEFQRDQLDEKLAKREADIKIVMKQYEARMDELKRRNFETAAKQTQLHEEWAAQMQEREEMIEGLTIKIDMLRAEVDRRDQLLREAAVKEAEANRDITKRSVEQNNLSAAKIESDQTISLLTSRLEILNREKAEMREAWQKQEAQWRELWDRMREMWDKKRERR